MFTYFRFHFQPNHQPGYEANCCLQICPPKGPFHARVLVTFCFLFSLFADPESENPTITALTETKGRNPSLKRRRSSLTARSWWRVVLSYAATVSADCLHRGQEDWWKQGGGNSRFGVGGNSSFGVGGKSRFGVSLVLAAKVALVLAATINLVFVTTVALVLLWCWWQQ